MTGILSLIGSPVSRYVAIVMVLLAGIAWIRNDAAEKARLVAEEECRATVQARVDAELERQHHVAETVLEQAKQRLLLSEAEAARLQEEANALLEELQARGENGQCPLDPDTRRRLLNIR